MSLRFWTWFFTNHSSPSEPDWRSLSRLIGCRPKKKSLYRLAFVDPSLHKHNDIERINTNDRLEFLGDSLLGMVVTKHLFERNPGWPVGKLSALKSHIVSRAVSNKIASEIGLGNFLHHKHEEHRGKDALGNALEALIGAIYLDQGFRAVERFIEVRFLPIYYREKIGNAAFGSNYKSELQTWCDHHGTTILYELVGEGDKRSDHLFITQVYVGNEVLGQGRGKTKKASEQEAAQQALTLLQSRTRGLHNPTTLSSH